MIPEVLRNEKRWLNWDYESRGPDKKPMKPCFNGAGQKVGAGDRSAWVTHDEAASYSDKVGFSLAGNDLGLVCIDLDNCRCDVTGDLDDRAREICDHFNSYTEYSPSGDGVKIWIYATDTWFANKASRDNVEIFVDKFYLTVTGRRLDRYPDSIGQRSLGWLRDLVWSGESATRDFDGNDQSLAVEALQHLDDSRADDYDGWLQVGMALKAVDDGLLDAWDSWSQVSSKWEPGVCAEKWSTFTREGDGRRTLGSLCFWASEDSDWTPSGGALAAFSDELIKVTYAGREGQYYVESPGVRREKVNVMSSRSIDRFVKGLDADQADAIRNRLDKVPPKPKLAKVDVAGRVFLPDGQKFKMPDTVKQAAAALYDDYYLRGDVLASAKNGVLKMHSPGFLCTALPRRAEVCVFDSQQGAIPVPLPESTARQILQDDELASHFRSVNLVTTCPVLTDEGVVTGYHEPTGTLVTGGDVENVPLDDARPAILHLFQGFDFYRPADLSRAVAMLLTPAVSMGDLLSERVPIDFSLADLPGSGKGLRLRMTHAVYNCGSPGVVVESSRGVGSSKESFDTAVIHGRPFVYLDNWQTDGAMPWLDSFMTEDSYSARAPFGKQTPVVPRRHSVGFTSNGVLMRPDTAARCLFTRVNRRPENYDFEIPDIVEFVRERQGYYLGCVFAVVREWLEAGKPWTRGLASRLPVWAGSMDWMVRKFDLPPLLEDHETSVLIASNAGYSVLHRAIAIVRRNHLWNRKFTASDIAGLLGVDSMSPQQIGQSIRPLFRSSNEVDFEGVTIRSEDEWNDLRNRSHLYVFEESLI